MIALIIALMAVEVVLIRILATRLSRPIEGISQQLRSVESLSFDNLSSQLQDQRNRTTSIGGVIAAQLAAIILVFCPFGHRAATHRLGRTADFGCGGTFL